MTNSITSASAEKVEEFLEACGGDDIALSLLDDEAILRLSRTSRAGFLWRKSSVAGWYRYWFALKGSQLFYFERAGKRRGPLVGMINLFQSKALVATQAKRTLELDVVDKEGKTTTLRAESKRDLHFWLVSFAVARKTTPPARRFELVELEKQKARDRASMGSRGTSASAVLDSPTAPLVDDTERIPVHQHETTEKVDHVICIVHGVGAGREMFTRNVSRMQDCCNEIMQRIYPDIDFCIEFLAVHWKELLTKLETSKRVSKLVPAAEDEGNSLREFFLDKVQDFLYFSLPRYKHAILSFVCRDLNAQYSAFRERHPDFSGHVSVVAHSLGSVLMFELLAKRATEDPALLQAEGLWLNFPVREMFMTGSPLGEFLNLDDALLAKYASHPTAPFRILNIFHPNDPVALRIEPLLEPEMYHVAPIDIPYWMTMNRHVNTVKWLGSIWGGSNDKKGKAAAVSSAASASATEVDVLSSGRGSSVSIHQKFVETRGERIDYALQVVNAMEEVSKVYSATKAHTEYWASRDVMLFMVTYVMKRHKLPESGTALDLTSILTIDDGEKFAVHQGPDDFTPESIANTDQVGSSNRKADTDHFEDKHFMPMLEESSAGGAKVVMAAELAENHTDLASVLRTPVSATHHAVEAFQTPPVPIILADSVDAGVDSRSEPEPVELAMQSLAKLGESECGQAALVPGSDLGVEDPAADAKPGLSMPFASDSLPDASATDAQSDSESLEHTNRDELLHGDHVLLQNVSGQPAQEREAAVSSSGQESISKSTLAELSQENAFQPAHLAEQETKPGRCIQEGASMPPREHGIAVKDEPGAPVLELKDGGDPLPGVSEGASTATSGASEERRPVSHDGAGNEHQSQKRDAKTWISNWFQIT
ncbi:Phospholipase DDHD1 [Porphyridium purpureum]|uniref:Phospholipase DDHD1 n=1 Tax=Porphyridium purpureum TaxID=35688 RepID=A0A5J4Z9Z9_PORPP|nr:Phospholipase DDHD1 [Porphyridium purpureum]|eukprot:POR5343..scf295_1